MFQDHYHTYQEVVNRLLIDGAEVVEDFHFKMKLISEFLTLGFNYSYT